MVKRPSTNQFTDMRELSFEFTVTTIEIIKIKKCD